MPNFDPTAFQSLCNTAKEAGEAHAAACRAVASSFAASPPGDPEGIDPDNLITRRIAIKNVAVTLDAMAHAAEHGATAGGAYAALVGEIIDISQAFAPPSP